MAKILLCVVLLAGMLPAADCLAVDEAALGRCAAIEDPVQRLDCYDTLAGRPLPDPEQEFGLPPRTVERAPDRIEATVIGVRHDAYGKAILELANGQVWKLVDTGRPPVRGDEEPVSIERALLGSYMLQVHGFSGRHRVKRIR